MGQLCKTWFGVDAFWLKMPSNLRFEDIKEVRILPCNRCFYAEWVYLQKTASVELDSSRALGSDTGLVNWLTWVSNINTSFIIDGRHIKSMNQWFNKSVATILEGKPQGFWSLRLAKLTEKRHRHMGDAINKAARIVVKHWLEHKIGRIVFGWNQGIKKEINIGKRNNQSFVQIPTAKLTSRIAQLCEQYGIQFVETEEANTSAASFLDGDTVPKYGEKPSNWKSEGSRVKRGLFRTELTLAAINRRRFFPGINLWVTLTKVPSNRIF
jgi:IS605 OrfB family transposase